MAATAWSNAWPKQTIITGREALVLYQSERSEEPYDNIRLLPSRALRNSVEQARQRILSPTRVPACANAHARNDC